MFFSINQYFGRIFFVSCEIPLIVYVRYVHYLPCNKAIVLDTYYVIVLSQNSGTENIQCTRDCFLY